MSVPEHYEHPSPGAEARGLRILIADDDAFAAMLLARLLRQDGHSVAIAGSLNEACTIAEGSNAPATADGCTGAPDRPRPFNLLIADLDLPDGSGLTLLNRIRSGANGRGLRGITITGFDGPGHATCSIESGFSGHLVKPLAYGVLQQMIQCIVPTIDAHSANAADHLERPVVQPQS